MIGDYQIHFFVIFLQMAWDFHSLCSYLSMIITYMSQIPTISRSFYRWYEIYPPFPTISSPLYMLHLISLNKYVLTLILHDGNSCSSYNLIVSLQIYLALVSNLIIPFIEKIHILLVLLGRYNSTKMSIFPKFVLSSIIRCLKIRHSHSFKAFKVSLFSLKVLSIICLNN